MWTLVLLLAPAIRFSYQVSAGEFGTFPLSGMVYWSGVWATVILLFALVVTPVAKIFRWHAIIDVRRMAGVTALVYTMGHAFVFFSHHQRDDCAMEPNRRHPLGHRLNRFGFYLV
jgi:DMSO/TMAO reductase YedYZ heme-binding membrane subunit